MINAWQNSERVQSHIWPNYNIIFHQSWFPQNKRSPDIRYELSCPDAMYTQSCICKSKHTRVCYWFPGPCGEVLVVTIAFILTTPLRVPTQRHSTCRWGGCQDPHLMSSDAVDSVDQQPKQSRTRNWSDLGVSKTLQLFLQVRWANCFCKRNSKINIYCEVQERLFNLGLNTPGSKF